MDGVVLYLATCEDRYSVFPSTKYSCVGVLKAITAFFFACAPSDSADAWTAISLKQSKSTMSCPEQPQ